MHRCRWVAIVVAVGASGCSPKYLEDLTTPALVWRQGSGLCSKIVAVDGGRTVWRNQGCEDGRPELTEVRTASQAQVDDLWGKFEALPPDQGATLKTCSGHLLDSFQRWEAQSRLGTSACDGTEYDDVADLPDAFRPLADALQALE